MSIRRIPSGGEFEEKIGYCRAVVAGGFVHVAGCTGTDRITGEVSPDVTNQCRQCLDIIEDVLKKSGVILRTSCSRHLHAARRRGF